MSSRSYELGWLLGLRACVPSRFSRVWLFVILWNVTCQAPLSMGFSRQEYRSGLPFPSATGTAGFSKLETLLILMELIAQQGGWGLPWGEGRRRGRVHCLWVQKDFHVWRHLNWALKYGWKVFARPWWVRIRDPKVEVERHGCIQKRMGRHLVKLGCVCVCVCVCVFVHACARAWWTGVKNSIHLASKPCSNTSWLCDLGCVN